ncbi:MAG: hypothetical protein QOD92_1020 [Acidimicrobiaceae bacterium]
MRTPERTRDDEAVTQVGLVTILFTDLVDSTRLASELGPAAADELRRTHFQSLREVIAAHEGREVKNTGDGLMVAFDRPSDGAVCAVGLQRRTERFARHHPSGHVAIRIGLAIGEATSEDGDWFGPPVVEAARLCAVAAAGQILATEVVRALGGGRSRLEYTSRGSMTLKGLPDPVAVVEIGWEPEQADAQLPPLLASMGGPFFVGRDFEGETLLTAWKQSLEGKRRAVLVAGEPGIGKTRLVRELAARTQEGGATILYGACDEHVGLAYRPFVEAVTYLLATCDGEVVDRHVAAFGGELTRIVPDLALRAPDAGEPLRADPDVERHRLFEAATNLLSIAAEGGGVVLILDDLHWADKGTLMLLRHLLRGTEPTALLVIGTYRDTDLARTHPLAEMLADFRRLDAVDRLMLSGLDLAGVEAFVEAAAGQRLGDDGASLARAVHSETEGNPFFVGQVLRHLAESGAIFEREGQWSFEGDVAHLGIPEGVREVIGHRLNRLADDVNRVLRTAAVIGREFDLRLVAEVDDLAEDDVVDALEIAAAARLVVEMPSKPDCFMYAHALVRESLYEELSTSRRTRLHKRIGEALERRPDPPLAALAHHFCEAAAMGDVEKAADYACRAGDEACVALAQDDAAVHYTRGIEVLDEAGVSTERIRIALLTGLANAYNAIGRLDEAVELAAEAARIARALDNSELFARAAVASAVGAPPVPNDVSASLLEEALRWLPRTDSPLRARVLSLLGRALPVINDPERRIALAAEAVAIARRIDDREALVEALSVHHDANWGPANVEERLAIAEEMARLETGQTIGFGDVYRFADLLELGDIQGSTAAADGLEFVSKQTHERGMALWAQVFRTVLELFSGDLEAAEARLMAWFADHRGVSDEMALQMFGVQFFIVRREQGRCEEVEPPIRALIAENPEIVGWRAGLAMLLTELDQRDEVHDLFERLATNDFTELLETPVTYTLNLALATEACSYLRDAERAQVLYAALLPYAGRNIQVGFGWGSIGAASHYLAMLAVTMELWDDAERHFEAALDMNEKMGARPWLARTAYEFASMLKSSGRDDDRADELLAQAAALATDVGMPVLAQRVAALRV